MLVTKSAGTSLFHIQQARFVKCLLAILVLIRESKIRCEERVLRRKLKECDGM